MTTHEEVSEYLHRKKYHLLSDYISVHIKGWVEYLDRKELQAEELSTYEWFVEAYHFCAWENLDSFREFVKHRYAAAINAATEDDERRTPC